MIISRIRIKSFRTIVEEQEFEVDGGVTLVGPNNSGKTNSLLALRTFFTGYENRCGYDHERDVPYGVKGSKTSITVSFIGEDEDEALLEKLARLRGLLGEELKEQNPNEFSINVYFNDSKPVYQIHPGVKRPTNKTENARYSVDQKKFIIDVLDSFQWYYIPSNKSMEELYNEFVTPFVRKKVAAALQEHDDLIKESISNLTDSMNELLETCGIDNVKTSMEYPNETIESFILGLDLHVTDESKSSIFEKGMGTQAAVIISSFKWITEQEEKKVIWLIEEPETFMHPGLAEKCSKLLDQLSEIATVVKTTHALNFIPSAVERVRGVERSAKGQTVIRPFKSPSEASESIRKSLGVKFSDFFGLSNFNLFLEGETDRMYLNKVIEVMPEDQIQNYPLLSSKGVHMRDFTGVTDLKGFLKANLSLIRNEVSVVSLFDGDTAGISCIRELAGYFGTKGGFNANNDYVLIPGNVAIEGVFPQEWIKEAYQIEPAWFSGYIEAADGSIADMSIRDQSKKAFLKFIFDKIDVNRENQDLWRGRFKSVLDALESALAVQARKFVQ